MDEQYRAKLTGSPPHAHRPSTPMPPGGPGPNQSDQIHIQPHPFPDASGHNRGPVPIHLPNIYVNPYPPPPPPPPVQAQHAPEHGPINVPTLPARSISSGRTIKIGPWRVSKPHPLLWLCLALSVLALVLEVPKGSLPTLTGRHKALRTREKMLQDRLNLITQLSVFLPPPLSNLVSPPNLSASQSTSPILLDDHLRLAPGLKFWNTQGGFAHGLGVGGEDGRWWSVEDLGSGASVVKSKREREEKEVWVLRVGEGEAEDKTLLHALTHSLLLRDKLDAENAKLKSTPCPACPPNTPSIEHGAPSGHFHELDTTPEIKRDEWERIEERKKREREREREVEEREREVGRREKWVVDEMRKLSDKVHSQATELTLEDRITERLKAYQRQLAQVHEHEEL